MTKLHLTTSLATILAVTSTMAAHAQTIPSAAQPGRVQQQLEHAPEGERAVDVTIPPATPEMKAHAQASDITFNLVSLKVEGVTVYSPEQLKPLYAKYMGKKVSLADLYDIASALTAKYRNDGYILSQVIVPQQNVTDGRVYLQAVEGFINKVYIQPDATATGLANSRTLQAMAKKLESKKPLSAKLLERNLLLMNDLPGLTVKGVVKASPNTPRAADLFLVVSRKKFEGEISTDNRGTRYVGPGQIQGEVTVNQLTGVNDSATLRAGTAYQTKELVFGEANYHRVLTNNGLAMDLTAGSTITHPGASLKPFEVYGRSNDFSAQLSYPLIRSRAQTLEVYGKADASDVTTKILGARFSKDRIRAARIGSNWTKQDSYLGNNFVNAEVTQGIDGLGGSDKSDPVTRPAFSPKFTKLNVTAYRDQAIRNSNFSVFGGVTGQISSHALLASEEFGVGGETFGSAYDSSEITGDSGAAARLEGRYTTYPGKKWLTVAQPYAFYDIGIVHNRDAGVGVNDEQTLASAGVGARFWASEGFSAGVEIAKPISRPVASWNNTDSPRIHFTLRKTF